MTLECDLAIEDLVAYAEGELRGARKEWAETHLAVCPHCQERFAAFAAVGHLLEAGLPVRDDPEGRITICIWVEQEAARRAHSRSWFLRGRLRRLPPQWPRGLVVAISLKVTLLGLLFWPGIEWTGGTIRLLMGGIVMGTMGALLSLAPWRPRLLPRECPRAGEADTDAHCAETCTR